MPKKNVTLSSLLGHDMFARLSVERAMKRGQSQEQALRVYVNSAEKSELPVSLFKYAKQKGWKK